ncbi:hypothetical protein K2173_023511 [Erythroxylum novogranatense]|uniref:Uncharacterized protein n=1 Tax=Erythroxylum novogranatense TaxID=1862640 RepID=A0AAV8TNR2_9ROSI|nr:hypothetical protein K2173_023511 [Erythroxylum novogranatense]
METDLSLIEISAVDDSLIIPTAGDVSGSVTGFSCSPLHQIPGSNPSIRRPPLPPARFGSVKGVDGACKSNRESVDDKENSNLNKTEVAKLSLEPHKMKRKKKGGGYNLRKSLAWDRAFFTEEGVLDPLELSMLSGNSGGEVLSVIHEGRESMCASEDSINESPPDLRPLEDNLFKELPKSASKKGGNVVGTSSPNTGASLAKEKAKRKVLSAQDINRSASQCSGRPRIQNFEVPKVATKNSKQEKVLSLKNDARGVSISTSSTDRSSRLKHNQIAQPVKSRKNIGMKGTSINAKNVPNYGKFGPASKMGSRSNPQQARRNAVNPAKEKLPLTKLNKPRGSQANNVSRILLDSGLPAACHPQTSHEVDLSVVSTPSSQSSSYCGGNIQETQIPTAKASGLRMPSPSLGFFHQSRSATHSLSQRNSTSYNVPNSSILNQRKPRSSSSCDEGNRRPLGNIPSGLSKEKPGASFSNLHSNAEIYDMDANGLQMKGDELLLQSNTDDSKLAEDNRSKIIDATVKIQDSIPNNSEKFHDPSPYDGMELTTGSFRRIDNLTETLNVGNANVQIFDNNMSVKNSNSILGSSAMVNPHSNIVDGLSDKSAQQSEIACTETERRESSAFNTAGKTECPFVDNAPACSADPELVVEYLMAGHDFQSVSNFSVSERMSTGGMTDAVITDNVEPTGVFHKTEKSAQQSEIACAKTERREYYGFNTGENIEGMLVDIAFAGSVDPELADENLRLDLDFHGASNSSVLERMSIGNMTDAVTTDNIEATRVCHKSEKSAQQLDIACSKIERREYSGLNTAGKIDNQFMDNALVVSVDAEFTVDSIRVELDFNGVSNSSLMSIGDTANSDNTNNIELIGGCNKSEGIGDSERKALHFSHQLCPFEQVKVAGECCEVDKQYCSSINSVAFSKLQPGTDIHYDEKSISIALDDSSKVIDDLSEQYVESINPVGQCYNGSVSETVTNAECESISDQIFNQCEILEQASEITGIKEVNKETGIEEELVLCSRRKSIADNCNMNSCTSTANTMFLTITGDSDKRLETCSELQNSNIKIEEDSPENGLHMDSKLFLMNVELVDSENRDNQKNVADFSEKGNSSSDDSKCFDVNTEAPSALKDVCLNMEKNDKHPRVVQTIPGAICVEQSPDIGLYMNRKCGLDKLADQATTEYDPFSNNSGDQIPLLVTNCVFKPFCSIDKPDMKLDETSNGSIFQDMEVDLLKTDNLQNKAETIILENSSCLDSEMQDELNTEISREEDNNKRRSLKRLANDEKKDELAIKPPPYAVPFSDEWLAAFEGAGEEILKMKGGAVQNSPPDRSLPEPSPWSPVKKKNNQGIGPFDCTKYSNTNIPHDSPS